MGTSGAPGVSVRERAGVLAVSDQWEGKERRARGRPPRSDGPATLNLTIRVTPAEKLALERLATRNRAESLADFCRLVLNEAAEDGGDVAPLRTAS